MIDRPAGGTERMPIYLHADPVFEAADELGGIHGDADRFLATNQL